MVPDFVPCLFSLKRNGKSVQPWLFWANLQQPTISSPTAATIPWQQNLFVTGPFARLPQHGSLAWMFCQAALCLPSSHLNCRVMFCLCLGKYTSFAIVVILHLHSQTTWAQDHKCPRESHSQVIKVTCCSSPGLSHFASLCVNSSPVRTADVGTLGLKQQDALLWDI